MSAVVLESEEFAYLLSVVHAESVPGIKNSALFPSDQKSPETVCTNGLRLMKEHGWIKPAEKPSQFHFNDTLYLMAAVIANPEFVVFTVRATESSARQVIMHYVAGPDIVELVTTAGGKFRLGIVPDKATLFQRLNNALDLQLGKQNLRIRFSTEEQTIEKIKVLAEQGKREQAAEILENLGLGGLTVESLLDALGTAQTNGLEVLKTQKGRVIAGRRAGLFRGKGISWLIKRLDADSNTLSAETIQTDTLSDTFDSFVRYLSR
ncbi:MAG: hypothetical protein JW837_18785 [Sedimentisphaerales bacterium]|nr:hypothetical protein [Sedimentisphaerales bacterium]